MCLIIHGPASRIRYVLLETPGLIENIYAMNGDGLGAMYASRHGPRVIRTLPRNAEQARSSILRLPHDQRALALHWRWRTHGAITNDQCHPYEIDGNYLMHNGVLDTGNAADTSKSDTWHYCRQFLSGGILAALAHEAPLQRLLADHIGAYNTFAVLAADGHMTIIGRSSGLEMAGLWWSNTYAWNPDILNPTRDGYYDDMWDETLPDYAGISTHDNHPAPQGASI